MVRVNPYLNFPGTAEAAFTFYRSVFGGEFTSLVRFRDVPGGGSAVPSHEADKILHVALPVGREHVLMASDALESLGQAVRPGNPVYLCLQMESREEADRVFAALSHGGEVETPLADQFWGDYYGSCRDRYGVQWMVAYTPPREA